MMKFIYISITFFILILFYNNPCQAQKSIKYGYIINNQQDTINGYVQYKGEKSLFSKCLFRKNLTDTPTAYKPGDLTAFGFKNGRCFVSNLSYLNYQKSRSYFAEMYIKGRLSFFVTPDNYVLKVDTLPIIILKNTKDTVIVNGRKYINEKKEFIGQLNIFLHDCQPIRKRLESMKFYPLAITGTLKRYYKYQDENYHQYYNPMNIFEKRLGIGILGGQSMISFAMSGRTPTNGLYNIDFRKEIIYGPVIYYHTQIPRVNERISIQAELSYETHHYYGEETENANRIHDATLDFNSIGLGFFVHYTYPLGLLNISPNLGIQLSNIHNLKLQEYTEIISGENINTYINNTLKFDKLNIGIGYGIGLGYLVWRNDYLVLDIKKMAVTGPTDHISYNSSVKNTYLRISYSHLLNKFR